MGIEPTTRRFADATLANRDSRLFKVLILSVPKAEGRGVEPLRQLRSLGFKSSSVANYRIDLPKCGGKFGSGLPSQRQCAGTYHSPWRSEARSTAISR